MVERNMFYSNGRKKQKTLIELFPVRESRKVPQREKNKRRKQKT